MTENDLSIIVPTYNDGAGIEKFLPQLIEAAQRNKWKIIVVNDGSTDKTAAVLEKFKDNVSIISNEVNRGYGFSIKRGILVADTKWVATIDADGQHRIEDLERMYENVDQNVDAIIGVRTKTSFEPLLRKPGKLILSYAANIFADQKIPDINCGLRIFRRSILLCILSITSDRFSFSTSTLIALIQLGCNIQYYPVVIKKRIGKSTVRQFRDGIYTLLLMTRLTFLFKPLRIILPLGLILLLVAFVLLGIHIFVEKMTYTIIMVWLTGLLLFLFSLLADQVSGIRKDALLQAVIKAKANSESGVAK